MVYEIGTARVADLVAIPSIERAGAGMLAKYLGETPLDDVTPYAELSAARAEGRLWTARAGIWPVGFALAQRLDGAVHLEEIDVLPEHGRRGVGTALIGTVCRWARTQDCAYVTLTTFRAVPWNMPFYARLGFQVLPDGAWTPALARRVAEEAARGLDPEQRVVMRAAAGIAGFSAAAQLAAAGRQRRAGSAPANPQELFDQPGD